MKKKIIILGTGFSAYRFLKKINKKLYDITVVSPRNHFLFTPLLPGTTVGTIEFRSIIEQIRNLKDIIFIQSYCLSLNASEKKIICEDSDTKKRFELNFDYLIIAVGEITNTFNIEGVNEYSFFLKELADARKIRNKVIDCFENASLPVISEEEKRNYLRFVVCGGGPTGIEFAAELHDFLEEDIKKKYKDLAQFVEIILVEARSVILATFDKKLSEYTTKIFKRQNITLKTKSHINSITDKKIFLNDGTEIDYSLLVWAAGNTATNFVKNSELPQDAKGKIFVDEFFKVLKSKPAENNSGQTSESFQHIFSIGDCTHMLSGELPATAQVAQQEGLFLAKYFNRKTVVSEKFKFKNLGMLAYIGGHKALADTPQFKGTGFKTFILWRSAYLTKLISFKNKLLVIFDWTKTLIFGRDVSNF